MAHITNMRSDKKLLYADLIHVQETSLGDHQTGQENCHLPGFDSSFINVGRGKGTACFFREGTVTSTIKEGSFQISKMDLNGIQCINVYRSHDGNITRVLEKLTLEIDSG